MERTVQATIQEIQRSPLRGRPAKTIFFGGGTPTYLDESQLIRVFQAVLEAHPADATTEITSEANPGTVDIPKFKAMHEAGFNRISLGAQSFLDTDLLALGRVHRSGEIERAVNAARDAGFKNINLDLMFALPDQSIHGWRQNLTRALAIHPEHLSLYCLTIEQNTAFYKQNLKGMLNLPDDEQQVMMYDECIERCAEAGYEQYEISNFAQHGLECKHNICYWNAEEYAGYGPGAVGSFETNLARIRYTNLKHPDRYCDAVETDKPIAFESEALSKESLRTEQIMLGLRMNTGLATEGLQFSQKSLSRLLDLNWIYLDDETIRLTKEGRHFCSEVALELI